MHGAPRRRAGEVVHHVRRPGRRPLGHDRRGPGRTGRAPSDPGGVQAGARPAVRLLHPRHDAHRLRADREEPGADRRRRPVGDLGAALPLHRIHEHREGDPGRGRGEVGREHARRRLATPRPEGARRHGERDRRDPRDRPQRPSRGGRPVHPWRRQLHRRHPPPGDAAHGHPAEPVRPREHQGHRRVEGAGAPRRDRGGHRRADGPAQPRVDADAVGGHAGGPGDRQGAVPGAGGRGGHRHRPLHRERRARADRRRLRGARRRDDAAAGARGRRPAHPDRQGRPGEQPRLLVGGRRQGGDGRRVLTGRRRRLARHVLPPRSTRRRSRRADASRTSAPRPAR